MGAASCACEGGAGGGGGPPAGRLSIEQHSVDRQFTLWLLLFIHTAVYTHDYINGENKQQTLFTLCTGRWRHTRRGSSHRCRGHTVWLTISISSNKLGINSCVPLLLDSLDFLCWVVFSTFTTSSLVSLRNMNHTTVQPGSMDNKQQITHLFLPIFE